MKTKTAYIYGIKTILLAYFLTLLSISASEKTVTITSKYQTIFDSYCTDCHNAKRKKGKVRLDKDGFSFDIKTIEDADKWHTILEVMNSKEMPPEDEKQLPENVKADFLETLSRKLVEARSMLSDSGGKTVIRRMNRREYSSSMKVLLGVNIDTSELPDDKSTGFDTDGASLFMSAGQIEIYQDLAKKALTNALTAPTDKPLKIRRESEERINPLIQKMWRDTILKNYTNARRYFYAKSKDKSAKASDFDLIDEQDAKTRLELHWSEKVADYVHYTSHPLTRAGLLLSYDSSTKSNEEYILIGNAPKTTGKKTPKRKPRANKKPTNQQNPNPPAGLYKLRLRVGTTPEAIPEDSFMEMHINGKRIDTFHIKATAGKPQILEIDHEIKSDTDRKIIFKARINPKMRAKRIKDAKMMTGRAPDPSIWIDWVEWEGPLKRGNKNIDRLQMFLDGFNGNDTLLKNEIRNFTQLAYKGQKPSAEVIDKLADIFKQNIKNGKNKSEAMVNTLANVLASPNFLYMPEKHSGSQAKFLDKRELAVKLAAFLWSSSPDKKLFEISSSQELTSQVKRMLQDPKLDNFIESFLYQWLHMERLS
ncbi:MAG: DUF1592 domain-containing protein, partial [Lentisphaerales bacterium]|nr:DUF1592 domain-containing protein [Lentisphaerales bacterium]